MSSESYLDAHSSMSKQSIALRLATEYDSDDKDETLFHGGLQSSLLV